MVVKQIVEKLIGLGFSENEAKVYAALVAEGPASAYELSRQASVPTSKIYEVLGRLEEQGIVSQFEEGSKKRYLPLDPDEFVARRRDSVAADLNDLEAGFSAMKERPKVSSVWNIDEPRWFRNKAFRMIEGARESILLSVWAEEFGVFYRKLREAERRGVKLCIVHFGNPERVCGQLYAHPIGDTLYAERGGRGFTMVTDSNEALLATLYPQERVEGAWSLTPGFVTVAEDYIKHDVYVMKMVRRFDGELIRRFGRGYEKLRDVFRDEEVQ